MLALFRQHPEQPLADRSGSPDTTIAVPTTPTAKVATMHPMTDAPSPSHKDTDRPFQCHEPGCGRRFNRKFTLSEHIKTHTGEKPYECPVSTCSKRFSTSGNLARHKRLHVSIKPFECTVDNCKRSFPNERKLQQHLKIHLGGKTHMCKAPGCRKSFSTAGNLTRHMKNHHTGSSARGDDSNPYRGVLASMHHRVVSHSPVSVANSLGSNDHHNMYGHGRHVLLTSYAAGNHASHSMYAHPTQPPMANLYYNYSHGDVHETGAVHHTQHHHQHHHMPGSASFPQHTFLQQMYEDVQSVHPLHPHDSAASLNLFDDVIEFQLGHPRMI